VGVKGKEEKTAGTREREEGNDKGSEGGIRDGRDEWI
jgi:hypothetical protein